MVFYKYGEKLYIGFRDVVIEYLVIKVYKEVIGVILFLCMMIFLKYIFIV